MFWICDLFLERNLENEWPQLQNPKPAHVTTVQYCARYRSALDSPPSHVWRVAVLTRLSEVLKAFRELEECCQRVRMKFSASSESQIRCKDEVGIE